MTATAPRAQGQRLSQRRGEAHELGPRRSLPRRLLQDRLSVVGLVIIVVLLGAALGAPLIAAHDPDVQNTAARLLGPSAEHLLGTDHLGRDNLSRLLYGARWSLGVAVVVTVIVMVIGVGLGMAAGYFGRWTDAVVMRLVDMLLALPNLVLALAIVGTLGPGIRNVMIALVLSSWVLYARVARGLVLSVREREFVLGAHAVGASHARVLLRHILPNIVSPVLVLATLQTGRVVLALAALGFFGLGVEPPTPEWGTMLNEARPFLLRTPELMIYPGAAITVAVVGFNLLGDGLRDVFDPRLHL